MNTLDDYKSRLENSIHHLYWIFSRYFPELKGPIGCIDFGGTEEERKIFRTTPLRSIPLEYIRHLEFFDPSWESWGSEKEVKYILPRIFECVATDLKLLRDAGTFSLFKYKLSDIDQLKGSKWNAKETQAIKDYLEALFEYAAHTQSDLNMLLEVLCSVTDELSPYLQKWQEVPEKLQIVQIKNWLKDYIDPTTFRLEGVYCDNLQNLEAIKSWITRNDTEIKIEVCSEDPWWEFSLKVNSSKDMKKA